MITSQILKAIMILIPLGILPNVAAGSSEQRGQIDEKYIEIIDQLADPRRGSSVDSIIGSEWHTPEMIDVLLLVLHHDERFRQGAPGRSSAFTLLANIGLRGPEGGLFYDHDGQVQFFVDTLGEGERLAASAAYRLGRVTDRHRAAAAEALGKALRDPATLEHPLSFTDTIIQSLSRLGDASLPWLDDLRNIFVAPSDDLQNKWRARRQELIERDAVRPFPSQERPERNTRAYAAYAMIAVAGIQSVAREIPRLDDVGREAAGGAFSRFLVENRGFGAIPEEYRADIFNVVHDFHASDGDPTPEQREWLLIYAGLMADPALTMEQRQIVKATFTKYLESDDKELVRDVQHLFEMLGDRLPPDSNENNPE